MPDKGIIAPLTSIRFLAAFYVLFYHLAPTALRSPAWFRDVVEGGYIGVSFFFVLSGFILALNYLERWEGTTRGAFWRARFARVYPVYALGLLAWLPFELRTLLRTDVTVESAGAFATEAGLLFGLLQSWFPSHALDWNEPAWSLSVEAFLYLSFPWIVPRVMKLSRSGALRAALAAWVVAVAVPLAYVWLEPDGREVTGFGSPTLFWFNFVRFGPWAHVPQFVVGILAARIYLDLRDSGAAAWPRRHASMLVLAIAAITLFFVAVLTPSMYLFLNNGLMAPCFALMILLLCIDRGPLQRLLALPGIVLLGEASYALYIGHQPLAAWWSAASRYLGIVPPIETVPGFIAYAVCAVLLSVIVLRVVEVPARRALRGRNGHRPPVRPSVTASSL